MAVEEGHVINIDGANKTAQSNGNSPATTANKYKSTASSDRAVSGVGRNAGGTFQTLSSDNEDGTAGNAVPLTADRVSVLSGGSGRSKTTSQLEAAAKLPWYRGVTCKDIRDIMPTVLILLGGLLIMIFVIPYAFSSVIKQLEAEEMLEKAREAERARKAAAEAAAKEAEATTTTTTVMALIQAAVTSAAENV